MSPTGILCLLLIAATIYVSWRGFKSPAFFSRYAFEVEKVQIFRQRERLITSGFLHTGWLHLLFNMFSLYFFGIALEAFLGPVLFLVVYFMGMAGGNLLSLYIHRHNGAYSSVGASGAVCAVIYSSIVLNPNMGIGLFFIPIAIPAWIYGLAYVLIAIYGIRSRSQQVAHDAHLGGALLGMLLTIVLFPAALLQNWLPILAILLPTLLFFYILIRRPQMLYIPSRKEAVKKLTAEDRYNLARLNEQQELDRILEKIHQKGMNSLSRKEKQMLKELSKD